MSKLSITTAVEPQRGSYVARIHLEDVRQWMLMRRALEVSEFGAGLRYAIEKGWLELHESGTYVRLLTPTDNLLGQ